MLSELDQMKEQFPNLITSRDDVKDWYYCRNTPSSNIWR
jgi:hypothetical protein